MKFKHLKTKEEYANYVKSNISDIYKIHVVEHFSFIANSPFVSIYSEYLDQLESSSSDEIYKNEYKRIRDITNSLSVDTLQIISHVIEHHNTKLDKNVLIAIEQCFEIYNNDIKNIHQIDFIYYTDIAKINILKKYLYKFNINDYSITEMIINPFEIRIELERNDIILRNRKNKISFYFKRIRKIYNLTIFCDLFIYESHRTISKVDLRIYNREYKLKKLLA